MTSRRFAVRFLETAVFMAMMYVVIQLAVACGIEEKSWLQRSWEFVVGGGFGLIAGVAFFVVFGTIGWVCGPIYGSIGLVGLMAGGALGGLGLGALVNIIRNPSHYNFNWPIIIATLVIGGILSKLLSSLVSRKIEQLSVMHTLDEPDGTQLGERRAEHDAAQYGESAAAPSPACELTVRSSTVNDEAVYMSDQFAQYRINTNWRYHVHRFAEERKKAIAKERRKAGKSMLSTLEYCSGDAEYANALDQWLEFMVEEERFVFFVHFVSQSLKDAKRSLQLLVERKEEDPHIRMPLLRDSFTCYSRPFKYSHGRLGRYRLEEDIGTPEPRDVHKKVIHDRDKLYAHCELSVRSPRVSKVGISLIGTGYYWDDYIKLLPSIQDVFDSAIRLVESYVKKEGMADMDTFFSRFESTDSLTDLEPKLLNDLYGYESNKGFERTC